LHRCWHMDPNQRPDWDEIQNILELEKDSCWKVVGKVSWWGLTRIKVPTWGNNWILVTCPSEGLIVCVSWLCQLLHIMLRKIEGPLQKCESSPKISRWHEC
jgi:hypothetical protein